MAAPDLSVSPDLAAQFGVQPAALSPFATDSRWANAVAAAPSLPAMGNPDPTIPAGLPPLGTPLAPAPVDPAAQQAVPVVPAVTPTAPTNGVSANATPRAGAPDQMAASTAEVRAAGQEATQVGQDSVEVAKQSAEDLAKQDQVRADEAQAASDRLTALQKRQETAYSESKASFDQAKQDVSNFKFHDFFSDQSFARQALAGIGMLLGGFSYDANHQNAAVGVVQSAIDRDSKRQLDYLHSKEHLAELAQQGVRDTQGYLAHEMANFQTAEALKKEAVARQIDAMSSTTRGKQNVVAARQVAASLRVSAAKDQQAAILQGTHNRVMLSEINKNNAEASKARAVAGGTGGDNPLDLKIGKAVDAQLNKDKVTSQLLGSRAALADARAAIATGNPVAIQGAMEAYIRAKTGGVARQATIKMLQERLGGSMDQLRAFVEEKKTGGLPPAMIKRFSGAVEAETATTDQQLARASALHEKALLRSPEYAKHADIVKAHLADKFGSPEDLAASAPAKPTTMYAGGKTYKLAADGKYY